MKDTWLKWFRVTAYFCMGTAGVLLLLSPLLDQVFDSTIGITMSIFLAAGGACAFFGALVEQWWGEYVGIPLLASAFSVFAVVSLQDGFEVAPYIALANFLLLFSLALALLARWRDVRAVFRLAIHLSQKEARSGE